MSYDNNIWKTGDTISADKLNHMEQGISDGHELPSVTAADNGKVLGVVNGKWGLIDIYSGEEPVT